MVKANVGLHRALVGGHLRVQLALIGNFARGHSQKATALDVLTASPASERAYPRGL